MSATTQESEPFYYFCSVCGTPFFREHYCVGFTDQQIKIRDIRKKYKHNRYLSKILIGRTRENLRKPQIIRRKN